ncbi:MAG: dockerin type I repeat-containing protein, partial [candidate division Zixibacteria bacterium]|nr:dockerin type I repeat-containing protein [candidate division Zixibacteria bacterium]
RSGSGPGGAGEILLTKRSDSGLPALLTLAPFANTTGVWYTIKVSCVDELLKVYVNNNPVLTYTDSADVYYSGGIGVTCYTGAYGSCDIAFDNVLVTDPYPHFEFDSPVVGEYVGDQIAISGKLAYRDGAPYVPSSGQLTVEDPAQDILATCQVQPNGTFVYSAPTAGTQEGLHMYVFACSTSSGLVYQSYNVGLSEPILLKNQSSETSLDVLMSRTYRPDAGGLQRTFNLPTDFLSIRKSNTAVKVTENNIKKGFRAIFGGIKSAVATGWNRTFNSGNPIAEWAKTTLRKCPGSGPPKCFLASGVLTYRFLSLPWEIVVGQLDNGLNKLHELGYIDDCTYQGAKTGLLAGKVIPAIGASVFGDPQSLLDAPNLGAELRGIKEEIEDRWDNCVDRATTNPYPSLAATFSADGYDGVLMAYLPKIPRAVVVSTFSPVEIAVMDPLGRVVSKTTNEIPGSDFMDFDMDMDGDSEQVVIVPLDSLLGDVLVNVTPRPGADPNAIFSVVANYTYYQDPIIIADSLLISQVPVTPIVVPTFENLPPTAAALLTTADTTFTGFPCDLEWTSATDPNPGHIVSYRVVVARQANFSDSVAVEVGTATTYTFNGRLWQSKAVTDTARYYWKVYAHDDWNESTASVDSRSFKVLYQCGDASGDRIVDISDAVYLIAYIFSGGAAPVPLSAGDANCDSTVDISDVVYLISYIFSGGAAPCEGCK